MATPAELFERYGVELKAVDVGLEIDTSALGVQLRRVADAIEELNASVEALPPMIQARVERQVRDLLIEAIGGDDGGH